MAQNWAPKQQYWCARLQTAVNNFCAATDVLNALVAEYTNDLYASGATNALTDTVVQLAIPAADAALVWYAIGELDNASALLSEIATVRAAALEVLRP
jgi:hypothetical protein